MSEVGRWLIFLSLVVSLVVTSITVGVQHLIKKEISPLVQAQQSILVRHLNQFERDSEAIAKMEFLKSGPKEKNAGPLMAQVLAWGLRLGSDRSIRSLPEKTEIAEKLSYLGKEWLSKHRLLRTDDTDLGFLRDLMNYDHWDLLDNTPLAKMVSSDQFLHPAQIPLPNAGRLIMIAKLRLVQGLNNDTLYEALVETRHLGKILIRSQNLILAATGISVLHSERDAYEFNLKNKKHHQQLADYEALSREDLTVARRYLWALRGYFRIWSPIELMERVVKMSQSHWGVCAALNEAIPFAMSFKPYLKSRFPFEMDFSKQYRFFEGLADQFQYQCRFDYVRHSIAKSPKSMTEKTSFFHLLPFFRRLVGLKLNLVPRADFEAYENIN